MKYNKINKSKVSGMPSRSTTDIPSSTVMMIIIIIILIV